MRDLQYSQAVCLLSLQAGLLAFQSVVHSPSTDEPAHVVAGISHLETGDFTLYRVTGPLCRLIGAVPAMLIPHEMEWVGFNQFPGSRPDYTVTAAYLRQNGGRIFVQVLLARLAVIPITLLGGWVCFRWSRELWGGKAGLLSLSLWVVSPHVLGQGYFVMTDISGAALYVTSAWLWWRWLDNASWQNVICFGFCCGILLLTKASFLLSALAWMLMWVAKLPNGRFRAPSSSMLQLLAAVVLPLYVVNATYGFDGTFRRLGSYEFVSEALAGRVSSATESGNRFADTMLGGIPVPLPTHYVLGVDIQKRYFERGLPSYLNGEWAQRGWWYYYLYGYGLKTPIGTLLLFGLALAILTGRPGSSMGWRGIWCLIVPPLVMLVLVSSQTGFSKNLRYAYPTLPFLHIFCGRALATPLTYWRTLVTWTLVAASAIESALVFPHSLSFFNAIVGTQNGHNYLLHSNVDFGQDLFLLKKYLSRQPQPVGVAFYGGFDPALVGMNPVLPPGDHEVNWSGPVPGRYAVSVNLLHGHQFRVYGASGRNFRTHSEQFTYFQEFEIDDWIGYSIAVYDLTEAEVNAVRAELGFKPWRRGGLDGTD